MSALYPLRFEAILKEKIWGGKNLAELFNKVVAPNALVGESWEICDRDGDQSVVAEGALKGATLAELVERYGERLVGRCPLAKGRFPLLFKIIDAQDKLSVQVHPTDELAQELAEPDPGKTEMWYVLAASEGAQLMLGLRPGITKADFVEAIRTGRFEQCLNYFDVKAGDAFFIPAGLVHALGAGIVLVEIQENSDLTYRVYDWGRVGTDGNPRETHLEKALKAVNFERTFSGRLSGTALVEGGNQRTILAACRYFATELIEINETYCWESAEDSFSILFFVQGDPRLVWDGQEMQVHRGQSVLVPAEIRRWTVQGKCKLVRSCVPDIEMDIIGPLVRAGVAEREIRLLGGDPDTGDVAVALDRWRAGSAP
jgi:mannose-6-phosphate isomerase